MRAARAWSVESPSVASINVETAATWSDTAAVCRRHSFSGAMFGGRIVSYRDICVMLYRIYHFLFRSYRAIINI